MRKIRKYIIGSPWLYYKLYSGPKILEYIYLKQIYPIIIKMIEANYITQFFFIRYQDPNYHIRLRMKLSNTSNIGDVISSFYPVISQLYNDNIISKIAIDVYNQELERYGQNLIECAEALFYQDSIYVSNYLLSNSNMESRLVESIFFIDAVFNTMEFNIRRKMEFSNTMFESYFDELYKSNSQILKLFNNKYRFYKKIIIEALEQSLSKPKEALDFIFCSEYLNSIKNISDSWESQMSSIIHMHINRLYRTNQRLIECLIYSLLSKGYNSILKINTYL